MKKFLLSLVIFFFTMVNPQIAQDVVYRNYTLKEGLPSQTVYCAIQDNEGFMWFGTDAGVCRFDGKEFRLFTTNDGLPDNDIIKMYKDSKGRIWFLSLKGILSYYLNGTIYNSENDSRLKKVRARDAIVSFLEDSRHNVWFGTLQSQAICITETEGVIYDIPELKIDSALQSGWVFIYEPSPGKVWVSSANTYWELRNGKFIPLDNSILQDILKNGNLINTGLYQAVILTVPGIYEIDKGSITRFVPWDTVPHQLLENLVFATVNSNKDIWLGGLSKQTLYFKRNGNRYDSPKFFLPG